MKTSPNRSYSVIENERFGLVFAKTVSIISGTGQIKSYPYCNKDGTQAFCSNYELQRLTNLNIFVSTSLNIQKFLHMAMVRMAQVVEWKAGYPFFPSCLPHFGVVCLNWAWITFNIKICLSIV